MTPGSRLAAAVTVVCACASVWAAQNQGRFQSGVELVVVPVAVTANGKPVMGLAAEDFLLTDNGVRQAVEAVSLDTLPIDVTLLLDASSSVRGTMLEHLKLAVTETAALLTPRDRLRLISVQHMIREVVPWQPGGATPALSDLNASGSTSLFDGVAAAMMRASPPDRRHLIVVFTDGRDTSSVVEPFAVQQIAVATDAVVHAVVVIEDLKELRSNKIPPPAATGVRGGSVSAGLSTADEQQLPAVRAIHDAVVGPTGGQVFPVDAREQLGGAFSAAIRAFRTSYVLRYSPEGVTKAGWHTIAVSITRSGRFDVRGRKGYEG